MDDKAFKLLRAYGQQHIIDFLEELDAEHAANLKRQIEEIDWTSMNLLIKDFVLKRPETKIPSDIRPSPFFKAEPDGLAQSEYYHKAWMEGARLIRTGKIALLTVAGGQGTRLGFDGPKGKFPITPVKKKTLFQYFAERISRIAKKHGTEFKWLIMTSPANDKATRSYFAENRWFGMKPGNVIFFVQGMMPVVGLDGRILLETTSSLALAPNGHGGTLLALRKCGVIDRLKAEGIQHISYFQVDNPLVCPADPLFIGLHALENSEMSSRALIKTGPHEKLGNFCIADGKPAIIEYSDMPDELAEMKDGKGELLFKVGSPAIHVFSTAFIDRLTAGGKFSLPLHRAEKKVPFIDRSGELIRPDSPNAVKLETFIFDALPMARKTVILEAKREEEFSPVKNPDGVDSVESCRRMLMERDVRWLKAAGVQVPSREDGSPACTIELSPLSFCEAEDVAQRFKANKPSFEAGKEYYIQ